MTDSHIDRGTFPHWAATTARDATGFREAE
jgi:hypothetical protein